MSSISWQLIASLLIVLAAAAIVGQRLLRAFTAPTNSRCGGCSAPAADTGIKHKSLVTIERPSRPEGPTH